MAQVIYRMVIIGESGAGKSETGNSILGTSKFDVSFLDRDKTWNSVFAECQRFGKDISIVDTPGPSTSQMKRNEENIAVDSAIDLMMHKKGKGPNVLLYCIRMGRISEETIKIMKAYQNRLGHEMMPYTIVVFTRHDDWQRNCERTGALDVVTDFEKSIPKKAQDFIRRCRGKVYFNNYLSGEEQENQVKELFSLIQDMIWRNEEQNYQVPPDLNPVTEPNAYNLEGTHGNSMFSRSNVLIGFVACAALFGIGITTQRFLPK